MQTNSNNFLRNSAILLCLSFATITPCFGDTIYLASGTSTQNNSGSPTIDISPNPA